MRSYAREVAYCKIYSFIMRGNTDFDFSQFDETKLDEKDVEFAQSLVQGVIDHKAELDAVIADLSRQFKLSRIYRPDLAALELGVYEMQYCDTPNPVVINEIVGFAKKYSTDKSVSFVNGILASFARSKS
ncbi:MAG: transcription antitermination factor NusB [Clostridia bacterium]|nr:transcription antitermination factor NusB [Clostridia bacterium]